jgi:hypothetical protein
LSHVPARGHGRNNDAAGVSKSVRHVLDLGDRTRYMEEGLGLLYSRPNPNELRKHEVWLAPTGKPWRRRYCAYGF